MIKFLIQRPVAVIVSFIVLLVGGAVLMRSVPLSLLPDLDVPKIVVKIVYPNTEAAVLEQNIVRPVREGLVNTGGLKQIETNAANHTASLYLTFEEGTRMDLAYVEINEKIDRLAGLLPRDMQRPQVIRMNTSDIPVIRIQVIPKQAASYMPLTALTEKVLKKRLEQLEGVSLVDINGKQQSVISVLPDKKRLAALGLNEAAVIEAIQNANRELGGLTLKDGQYRYFVKLINKLEDVAAIESLPVRLNDGTVITMQQVAAVVQEPEQQTGYHFFNGKEGLVITVQKQAESRMNELMPEIRKTVELFKQDYPQADFYTTQDQSFLMDAGIDNLKQDLVYGGILTILILFLFLGNWASPTLMSISIPGSLIITFLLFYVFDISFNIISISGLALGIGMLIDNSIVVIDNITRKRRTGMDMTQSCIEGTNEVITPVTSQVLTTVAVYAPLVLLSGIAGQLVYDQSIALTISLGVSLLLAFILSPLLYKMFLKTPPEKLREDTFFYRKVSHAYHKMISHIFRHKLVYFLVTIGIMPVGIWLALRIPVTALPQIEKKESLALIDWNAPIDAEENLRRMRSIYSAINPACQLVEAEVGIKQFLLQADNSTIDKLEVYFICNSEKVKLKTDAFLKGWLQNHYPSANIRIIDAPNAFTQIFHTTVPYLEARFQPLKNSASENSFEGLNQLIEKIPEKGFVSGPGMMLENSMSVTLDYPKMALYGVSKSAVDDALRREFGLYTISELRRFNDTRIIRLKTQQDLKNFQMSATVMNGSGVAYPISIFLTFVNALQPKFITADKTGPYRSIIYERAVKDVSLLQKQIATLAAANGFNVSFYGDHIESRQQLKELFMIFIVVLLLLYFILAIQYEDLVQPIVVMLTIPLGITGGMLFLWLSGGTMNVMAAVGFIVILGLIVDDPILKIEILNRLRKQYVAAGIHLDDNTIEKIIHEAGDICLKPLLMVSLTTSFALLPVLFVGGIGNDLQRPLAIVIIGGLTVGLFFTTWFIPLAYWYVLKWRTKKLN